MPTDVTTPQDFMPTGATGITPAGKKFYIQDIGHYKLRFPAKVSVVWQGHNMEPGSVLYTKLVELVYSQPGTLSNPIINSYYSPTDKKTYIEYDGMKDGMPVTYRTELKKEWFDLSPLETLPSVSEVKQDATDKSNSANAVHAIDSKPFIDQLTNSIGLPDFKTVAKYALIGGVAIVIINRVLKGK